MRKVWCVAARKESAFCDVYDSLEGAVAFVRKCLVDPHWYYTLPVRHRPAFDVLLSHGEFDDALQFYNEHVGEDDKWFIVEREVKNQTAAAASSR